MSADYLLKSFDSLGDDEVTIQQFRKLVIGLAISGKLSTSDNMSTDQRSMLQNLEAEKMILIRRGIIRKQAPIVAISGANLPQVFHRTANFVRLGDIARIEKGLTGIIKAEPGPYPLVVTAECRASCDHFDFDGAAAIVPLVSSAGHGKASLQRLHYQEGKFALGTILAAVFPHSPNLISARFLFEYLTTFKNELLVSQMIGTANVTLSISKISDVPVPLVPPAVQGKVDELMSFCDDLEEARGSREAIRYRFASASLARLKAPDPRTLQADAHLVLEALPALTTSTDQIKALRQTILNLAVRGKLVPQNGNDEPALQLLKRITENKVRPISKHVETQLKTSEAPFELPAGWSWSRIGEVCSKTGSGSTPRGGKEVYKVSGVPFLRSQNVYDDGLRLVDVAYIDPATHERMSGTRVSPGDLLLNITGGSMGRCCLVPGDFGEANVSQHVAIIRVAHEGLESFLHKVILSPYFQAFIFEEQTGAGRGGLPKNRMDQIIVAIPPLAEQLRIVTKVDELMALCDQLEVGLSTTGLVRRRLLDALLTEALMPSKGEELFAAE